MPPKSRAKATKAKKSVDIPKTPADLENCLQAFLSGDDAKIRKATEIFKAFLNLPASMPALFHRLSIADGNVGTRQLACVLITKKIGRYWAPLHQSHMLNPKVSDAETCRQTILTILHSGDAPRLLINSLAYLTSIIARLDFKRNRWPKLVEWLLGALQSTNMAHVEAALRILNTVLMSTAGEKLMPYYDQYYPLFCGWIQNAPDAVLRQRAILALHSLLSAYASCEDEQKSNKVTSEVLPALIQTLPMCHKNEEYDSVKAILTILVAALPGEQFEPFSTSAWEAVCSVVVDTELEIPVRALAIDFLAQYIECRPIRMTEVNTTPDGRQVKFFDLALTVVFKLLLEEDDDAFDYDTDTAQRLAITVLEGLMQYIPREEVFPLLVQKFIEFCHHQNPYCRKTAYVLVTCLSQNLPVLVCAGEPVTFGGVTKPLLEIALLAACHQLPMEQHPLVQEAILVALTWMCEEFAGRVDEMDLHKGPVQCLLSMLQKHQDGPLRKRLLNTLDCYIEAVGRKVTEFLPPLMSELQVQLNKTDVEQQEAAIETISAVASAVQDGFAPYFQPLLPILTTIINTPRNPTIAAIQDKSYRALSICARVVGYQTWTPEVKALLFDLINKCIAASVDNVESTPYAVTGAALTYLGNMVDALNDLLTPENQEMIAMFSKVHDGCCYALKNLSGLEMYDAHQDAPKLGADFDGSDDDDEDQQKASAEVRKEQNEDEETLYEDQNFRIDDDSLNMKGAALITLSVMMTKLGPRINLLKPCQLQEEAAMLLDEEDEEQPIEDAEPAFVDITTNPLARIQHIVLEASNYLEDYNLISALTCLTDTLIVAADMLQLPKQTGVRQPLPDEAKVLVIPVLVRLFEIITCEEDSALVAAAINQITALLFHFGASLLLSEQITQQFYSILDELFKENIPSLTGAEYKDIRSGQGEEVLEAAFEMVGQLALHYGGVFLVEFVTQERLGYFIDFCSLERPSSFREHAVGCIAEIMEYTAPTCATLVPTLFPLADVLLNDKVQGVRHNTMFLAGECGQVTTPEILATLQQDMIIRIYQRFLQHLLPLDQYNNEHASKDLLDLHDNALSSAVRFVLFFPQLFPYEQFQQLFQSMPMRGDEEEMVKMMVLLPKILDVAFAQVKSFVPQLIVQLGRIMSREYYKCREGSENTLIPLIKNLFAQCPADAQQAIALLQNDIPSQEALKKCLE